MQQWVQKEACLQRVTLIGSIAAVLALCPWAMSKMIHVVADDCALCRQDAAAVAASIALVVLTVMYMVSIIAIVLYIAYTPDRRRVGMSDKSSRECMVYDLDLLGHVRLAEERHSEMQCTVCLCDVEPNQRLRELRVCKHVFHQNCIDQWLLGTPVFSLTCPLCRGSLYEHIYSPCRVAEHL